MMTAPYPVWRRSFSQTEPDVYTSELPIDTTRAYPRTLMAAFPVSEGYRHSFFHPEDEPPIFRRKQRASIVDRACWAVSILALVWLCWAVLHAPMK